MRCGWLLLPWMATAAMPSRPSCSARRFAPCLVRVKTSACVDGVGCGRAELSSSRLRSRSTGWTTWVTSGAAELRGVTWTDAGSCRKPLARCRISSENVAENSRFWRSRREDLEDATDVADEAHVEHAVGLVEDEDLDGGQVDGALADVVEQATGRGDDDVRPEAQGAAPAGRTRRRRRSRWSGCPSGDHRCGRSPRPGARAHGSGRGRGRGCGGGRAGSLLGLAEALQHRQHERGRLAGARLGAGHEVAAGEDERDGLGLDRGGFGVALVGDGVEQLGREPEFGEGHGGNDS